ncbi:hypothetical protein PFISCL1PPCAC_9564, partial [Pristionchus fissidentatus]
FSMDPTGRVSVPTPSIVKSWHSKISVEVRNHLIGKLVNVLLPNPDLAKCRDQNESTDIILFSRKAEQTFWETADTKLEYYRLLAQKMYAVDKELQETRRRILSESKARDMGRSGEAKIDEESGAGKSVSEEERVLQQLVQQMQQQAGLIPNSMLVQPNIASHLNVVKFIHNPFDASLGMSSENGYIHPLHDYCPYDACTELLNLIGPEPPSDNKKWHD